MSRCVPGLKYTYIVRDSWTRLNVLPAKIMQVKIGIISIFNLLLLNTQQPYMLAAIREMSIKKADMILNLNCIKFFWQKIKLVLILLLQYLSKLS